MRHVRVLLGCLLMVMTGCVALGAVPTTAGASTGTLKLVVVDCLGAGLISNARVDVAICRPGLGQVASSTGYTDDTGYVSFTFTVLQNGDEAHVAVTPQGQSIDSGHIYYWHSGLRSEGYWSLSAEAESMCADGWYDERANTIQCLYR